MTNHNENNTHTTAIESIRSGSKAAPALVSEFMRSLVKEFQEAKLDSVRPTPKTFGSEIEKTMESIKKFARVALLVAQYDDSASAIAMFKGLELFLEFHESIKEKSYFSFIVHELICCLVAPFIRYEKEELIGQVLFKPLCVQTGNICYSFFVNDLSKAIEGISVRERSALLYEFHEKSLKDVCNFQDFMAADFFLFLHSHSSNHKHKKNTSFVPYSLFQFKMKSSAQAFKFIAKASIPENLVMLKKIFGNDFSANYGKNLMNLIDTLGEQETHCLKNLLVVSQSQLSMPNIRAERRP